MSRIAGRSLFSLILALIPGSVSILAAQDATQIYPRVRADAPVPAPTENKSPNKSPKVFISNIGSETDQVAGKGVSVTGGPGQAYNKFYAAVQSSGEYQLVGSPGEAEFVFEIRYTNPHEVVTEWVWVDKDPYPYPSTQNPPSREQKAVERIVYHPQLRLVIFDPWTHAVQAAFTERMELERTQQERDATFADAIRRLLGRAGNLLGHFSWKIAVPAFVNEPPAPSQIASAKNVFISNAVPSVRACNQFYAMMQSWGGYRLSPGTTGADLILQLSTDPQFRVVVLDPQTGVTLWGFTPDVGQAILKRNSRKDLDRALATIVQDIARMGGRTAPVSSTSQGAKDAATPPDAPIPPQLRSARTVFISNAGGEPLSDWKRRPVQPYNTFYATMKSWARFKLAPTPAEADLVFQISVVRSEPLVLRLTILDSRTQATMWELNQDIRGDQTIQGSFAEQKDLDKTVAALVTSVAKLTGQSDAQISVPPDARTAPPLSMISDFKKVFISRPREEDAFFEKNAPDQLYDKLDADIRSWGRYQLTAPSEADLIFEPSISGTPVAIGEAVWGIRVRLTIRDAKTRHVLWTFVRPLKMAVLNDTLLSNYKTVIGLLVDDLRRMASPRSQQASSAKHEGVAQKGTTDNDLAH